MRHTLIWWIASRLTTYLNNIDKDNTKAQDALNEAEELVSRYMPGGSGFNTGIQLIGLNPDKIVFSADFNHTNNSGYYEGWTEHKVTVKPSFVSGETVSVSGRNKNNIKEYIEEVFYKALNIEIDGRFDGERFIFFKAPEPNA